MKNARRKRKRLKNFNNVFYMHIIYFKLLLFPEKRINVVQINNKFSIAKAQE